MKLMDVLGGERKIRCFQLSDTKKIVLQSLTAEEARQVDRIVFSMFPNANFHTEANAGRVHLLARSLVSVDGIPATQLDDVAALLAKHKGDVGYTPLMAITEILGEQDNESINLFYTLYLTLEKENREEKDKIKDFCLAQKADSTGN